MTSELTRAFSANRGRRGRLATRGQLATTVLSFICVLGGLSAATATSAHAATSIGNRQAFNFEKQVFARFDSAPGAYATFDGIFSAGEDFSSKYGFHWSISALGSIGFGSMYNEAQTFRLVKGKIQWKYTVLTATVCGANNCASDDFVTFADKQGVWGKPLHQKGKWAHLSTCWTHQTASESRPAWWGIGGGWQTVGYNYEPLDISANGTVVATSSFLAHPGTATETDTFKGVRFANGNPLATSVSGFSFSVAMPLQGNDPAYTYTGIVKRLAKTPTHPRINVCK